MYIIAGLGNPGRKYDGSRHNTGWMVVDILSRKYGIPLDFEKHRAVCGKGIIEGQRVILAKPLTFMNLSGESIRLLVDYYKVDPAAGLIVISDDIDLPPGRIRVRPKGSAGGHNGLKNIISHLGTDNFARVKVGVGPKPKDWDLADWVLSRFNGEEEALMEESRKTAAEAVVCLISQGPDAAMNQFNRAVPKGSEET
jgi:PTH1 family peptidyl-tRNA hydrolase